MQKPLSPKRLEMIRSYFKVGVVSFSFIAFVPSLSFAQAARFTGGSCISQGDWVQGALSQSETIVTALETLRSDPNCSALVQTLDNTPQLKELVQSGDSSTETSGMAGIYSELQSIGTYLRPQLSNGDADTGPFRSIVNYMVFRKSLDAVSDIQMSRQYDTLTKEDKDNVDIVSQKLKSFLSRAGTVSNVAVATTKSILSAMPKNQLCFNDNPDQAGLIFSSLVSSAAALATGGQISNLGELVSSLVTFDRQMHFANILRGVELERYRTSMSCLVESTQEAYCALQDAQDALNFNRGAVNNTPTDPLNDKRGDIENTMQGLLVLLRDVPVLTGWFQKILFGIDPQLNVEANMKNSNWDSVVNFIKTTNTLPALYRDQRKFYLDSSSGQDNQNKGAMVLTIINSLVNAMSGNDGGQTINFFTTSTNVDSMPFFLMGYPIPPDYNSQMNTFGNIYLKWMSEQSHGLNNPDLLIETIGERLNIIISKASGTSSSYFSSRMIVDSQNLIVEGMNGPSISAYKALIEVRTYLERLNKKLQQGLQDPAVAGNKANSDAYKSMFPMIADTILRLDKITDAMSSIANMNMTETDISVNQHVAQKAMDVIYSSANMLTSRDSFIGTRLSNAVRMDISDTLWRKQNISGPQDQLLRSMGKDIVNRLGQYFTRDPILQRLDVAQAAPIHNQNLKAVEDLFVKNYWDQLVEIDCKILGGKYCTMDGTVPAPDSGFFAGTPERIIGTLTFAPVRNMMNYFKKPVEDSSAIYDQRARLCVQTLGFTDYYEKFATLCQGAVLTSEFSDASDSNGLNLSYEKMLSQVRTLGQAQTPEHISQARSAGVCALRSYIRRNNVFRMYTELQQQ